MSELGDMTTNSNTRIGKQLPVADFRTEDWNGILEAVVLYVKNGGHGWT